MIYEEIDTLVTNLGYDRVATLEDELAGIASEIHLIGDCLTPRTAEEAVLEGLRVGTAL